MKAFAGAKNKFIDDRFLTNGMVNLCTHIQFSNSATVRESEVRRSSSAEATGPEESLSWMNHCLPPPEKNEEFRCVNGPSRYGNKCDGIGAVVTP